MDIVLVIGRVLFAAIFILAGIGHFKGADGMAQYAKAKGVPAPKAGVLLSGVFAFAGGLSIALGVWPDLGALLIIAFLIPVTFFLHAPWTAPDAASKANELIAFNKNVALIGGALIAFYLFNQYGVQAGLISDPLLGKW